MLSSELKKTIFFITTILIIGILVTIYKTHFQPMSKNYLEITKEAPPSPTPNINLTPNLKKTILVHIAGEIRHPGIYKMDQGSRTTDLIKIAGGVRPAANLDKINLVAILKDGKKILIPATKHAKTQIKKAATSVPLININTSSQTELTAIPGIGPTTAQRIIEYRNTKGSFKAIKDLTNVKGIGPKTLKKIKRYLLL
jgi:competence protein ComEA